MLIVAGDDVSDFKFVPKEQSLDKKICYPEANKKALEDYLSLK